MSAKGRGTHSQATAVAHTLEVAGEQEAATEAPKNGVRVEVRDSLYAALLNLLVAMPLSAVTACPPT